MLEQDSEELASVMPRLSKEKALAVSTDSIEKDNSPLARKSAGTTPNMLLGSFKDRYLAELSVGSSSSSGEDFSSEGDESENSVVLVSRGEGDEPKSPLSRRSTVSAINDDKSSPRDGFKTPPKTPPRDESDPKASPRDGAKTPPRTPSRDNLKTPPRTPRTPPRESRSVPREALRTPPWVESKGLEHKSPSLGSCDSRRSVDLPPPARPGLTPPRQFVKMMSLSELSPLSPPADSSPPSVRRSFSGPSTPSSSSFLAPDGAREALRRLNQRFSGTLHKLNRFGIWQKRHCAVDNGLFSIRHENGHKQSHVFRISSVTCSMCSGRKDLLCFQIKPGSDCNLSDSTHKLARVIKLKADDIDSLMKWVSLLTGSTSCPERMYGSARALPLTRGSAFALE